MLDKWFNLSALVATFERIYCITVHLEFCRNWYSRNTCVRLFLSESTVERCSCVNTRAQSDLVLFITFCQVKLVSSTNLLWATRWESARDGSSFHFQSSPRCLLLSWHSFCNSCPVLFSPFFFSSKNPPSSKVSEMQCQARTLCAIWISVFVAKQLASKGFHYKSKSLSVMQLSRLWDEAGCVGGTPPHPLPVCACH